MNYKICGRDLSYGDTVKILGNYYIFSEANDKGYIFVNAIDEDNTFLVTHAMAKSGNLVKYNWETEDNINHPDRYCKGNIECIDAIESATSDLKGIEAF